MRMCVEGYVVIVIELVCCCHGANLTTEPTTGSPVYTPLDWDIPEEWKPEQVPNPRYDVHKCGRRGLKSWVCDPNGILSNVEANYLDKQIELLREHTGSCHCVEQRKCPYYEDDYGGWQASVAIIRKLYIPYL
ncbi:hypothetical protein CAPTEDRAFT_185505 [Capitella teleta]|uniref:Spaetzle domain-containing protein n=1 Tax=Capitella teleta TaxID=283909 RepID=R7VHL5_CAPTE|nr:hypothetical protein CAPTEDRAFT_185505 [Capitella teleta]|eukprot:ELU15786.1 hypothetical protein CAPTEDRAFT_185505 [Capitella teleta]